MKQDKVRTLTIAGLDVSGGAGLAADLTTFEEYGTYGQAILTTIVTMDPATWGHQVESLPVDLLKKQIDTVLTSDVPVKAMKTGMLGSVEIVKLAREVIDRAEFENVVIDPVLVCKGTDEVLNPDTADALRELLMPVATVATPNLFEAGVMAQMKTPETVDEMKEAAEKMYELGTEHVVIKGGRGMSDEYAIDLYYDGKEFDLMQLPKVEDPGLHGAGCSFAAAITAGLAIGMEPHEAARKAKEYVYAAIADGLRYNKYVKSAFRPSYRLEKQGGLFD